MEEGTLICVARYRKPTDPDLQFPTWDDMEDDFSYSVSAEVTGATPTRDFEEYTFDFFSQPIPANVFELELFVVYRGALGLEQDAVVFEKADVCEPDYFCLYNGTEHFVFLGEPFPANADNDFDGDGEYDFYQAPHPYNMQIQISGEPLVESPPPAPQINATLQAGEIKKYIILLEKNHYIQVYYNPIGHPTQGPWSSNAFDSGVINQYRLEQVVETDESEQAVGDYFEEDRVFWQGMYFIRPVYRLRDEKLHTARWVYSRILKTDTNQYLGYGYYDFNHPWLLE